MNRLSVSIVSYGSSEDVKKCIDSMQTFCPSFYEIDIFIVNNKKDDDNIAQVADLYRNVTFLDSPKNGGYGYGHNQAIYKTRAKYHAIINPDIIFTEDALAKLQHYMDTHSNVVLSTPEIKNIDDSVQHLPQRYPKLKYILSSTIPGMSRYRTEYTNSDNNSSSPRKIDICTGCFMFARGDILREVGGFDERFFMYFEDFDLSRRMASYGSISYIPSVSVVHKWNRESKKSLKMFSIQVLSMCKFYLKEITG